MECFWFPVNNTPQRYQISQSNLNEALAKHVSNRHFVTQNNFQVRSSAISHICFQHAQLFDNFIRIIADY